MLPFVGRFQIGAFEVGRASTVKARSEPLLIVVHGLAACRFLPQDG